MSNRDDSKHPSNGPAWAAILACGIGCAAIGLMTDVSEAFKSISKMLNFYGPTGDLSGKTAIGIVVWLVAWGILHARWKDREIENAGRIAVVTVVLIVLALIATFPLFFGLFAAS